MQQMPNSDSRRPSSVLWQTVSKAAEMSRPTTVTADPDRSGQTAPSLSWSYPTSELNATLRDVSIIIKRCEPVAAPDVGNGILCKIRLYTRLGCPSICEHHKIHGCVHLLTTSLFWSVFYCYILLLWISNILTVLRSNLLINYNVPNFISRWS